MSKTCTKCDKTVYPLEELKCLDKIWHKTCFKCWECGMTLNMKTYQGYDKKPYCSAHYPQTKPTTVADTPEMQRLVQASKNQSQAKYHEDFEKNIRGSKIEVADDAEMQRLRQLTGSIGQADSRGAQKDKISELETNRRQVEGTEEFHKPSPYSDRSQSHSIAYTGTGKIQGNATQKIGSISDYDPMKSITYNKQYNNTPSTQYNNGTHTQYNTDADKQYNNKQYDNGSDVQYKNGVSTQFNRQSFEWKETVPITQTTQYASGNGSQPYHQSSRTDIPTKTGNTFRAIYDYAAQDEDEVGFFEDEFIFDCQPIDDGWMFGTVERTGKRGMLPSNYVERA